MDRYIPFRNVECFRHTPQTTNNKFLRRVEQRLEHPYPKNIHENLADNKIPENSAKKHQKSNFHMRQGTLARPQERKLRLHN